jgi:nucleotide-binding universal stress UspA family protein
MDVIDQVLFATDFSANAEHAFLTLEGLVEDGLKSVVLMHVQDRSKIEKHQSDRIEEFNQIDQARLERMKDSLTAKGAENVQIELSYGYPKQEIIRRTKKHDISLVLMGSQGRGFVGEVFLGSVSHNVARHSLVPVLLIPMLQQ